jgi:phosphopantetheinyl transferase (holo-ACP synthase)
MRFLASEEYERWHANDHALTRAWSAKEAIYKAMAQPGLSFQEEIILPEFDQNPIIAQVQESELQVFWEDFDAFVLTIAGQI